MRKALIVLVLVLMLSSAQAYDLGTCASDTNFTGIGNCIVRGAFGDVFFFSLIMLALFSLMMWQTGVPQGVALGVGLIVFFALDGMLGTQYITMTNLIIVAIGTIVGLSILHFVRR